MILGLFCLFIFCLILSYHLKKSENEKESFSVKLELLKKELERYSPIRDINRELDKLSNQKESIEAELEDFKERLAQYELKVDIEEMGFYQPKFVFDEVLQYAEALDLIREAQKELVREKLVLVSSNNEDRIVTDKKSKEIGKLGVNSFNGEANSMIESVSFSNYEKSKEKIEVSFKKINKLLEKYEVKISSKLLILKIKEMA